MRFCSLSSCSYANSVVVQDAHTCVLVDCGLRCRDIKLFLGQVGLSLNDIDAVLVTHCHIDHVYGLRHFLKARRAPLYSVDGVLGQVSDRCRFREPPECRPLEECRRQRIGTLAVTPLPLSHDVETIGFVIEGGGERLGFMTDTGFVPAHCLTSFQFLDYLYIESNHDVEMYRHSRKPAYVVKRNLGTTGHLSNDQCGAALEKLALEKCRLVTLAHLSEDDNTPEKALACTRRHLGPAVPLVCAPSRVPGTWSDKVPATG